MTIRLEKILPLVIQRTEEPNSISALVHKIRALEEQINTPEEQSFYFQKGLASHVEKLNRMKVNYHRYQRMINGNTEDQLLVRLEDKRKELREWEDKCRKRPNAVNLIAFSDCRSSVREWEGLLNAKRQYQFLLPLNQFQIN